MRRATFHKRLQSGLRTSARRKSLVVERLECRRLLSAAPNRIELPSNDARLDAYVQRHDHSQDQGLGRGGKRDSGRGMDLDGIQYGRRDSRSGGRDNNQDRDQGQGRNRIKGPRTSAYLQSSFGLLARSFGQAQQASITTLRPNTTPIPSDLSAANPFVEFQASSPLLPSTTSLDRAAPQVLDSPLRVVESTLPTLETTITQDLEPRQLPVLGPRLVNSTVPRSVTVEAALPGVVSTSSSIGSFPVFVDDPTIFADAFAIAAHSFASFGLADEDEPSPLRKSVTASNIEEFGGVVDLDQIPKLVDTLPAVIDETSPLFELGEVAEEDEVALEDDATEHPPTDLLEVPKTQVRTMDSAKETKSFPSRSSHASDALADTSTDILFANAEDSELYGGEIEMPEGLACSEDSNAVIPFDSIIPAAPRIDQIISQAPLMEIENDSNGATEEEPEPISINFQASLPTAILCIPVVAVNATKRKQEQLAKSLSDRRKQQTRKVWL